MRESLGCVRLLQHGRGSLLCSSGSTCLEGNPPAGRRVDIWTGNSNSMGSNRSRPPSRRNRIPSVFADLGWSPLASRRLLTIPSKRCRRECERNPAAGRRSDGRSEAGSSRCKFPHHGGNMPGQVSLVGIADWQRSYPHGSIQGARNVIALFQSGAAS